MKIGSIVEVVKNSRNYKIGLKDVVSVIIECKCGVHVGTETRYDDSFTNWNCDICGHSTDSLYYTTSIDKFREIQFPPSLEQQIKESLTRELQTV